MNPSILSLHPDNPHYFMFRDKPTVLITAGEHYASVLNLEFDYRQYLETLHAEGLNHTRLFVGVYRELPDEWWPKNPLGPRPGQFACPFGRSQAAGAHDGGNKFDLNTWDSNFFDRLSDFCRTAEAFGVVIEINLFCPYYASETGDKFWVLSPWHAENNINDLGAILPTELFTLKHPRLVKYQEAMVKQVVKAVNRYGNLYFEICNEPYFDQVSLEWQEHMAEIIQEEERSLPLQHLISQNVANFYAEIKQPHPAFSIFNFHYPKLEPNCVRSNYALNKVIGCNETGFNGAADEPYRIQAWQFMLSGGGLFNHLDASFVAGDEAGSQLPPGTDKFAGGPRLRQQLRILKDFVESFDFVNMAPDRAVVEDRGGAESVLVLAQPGEQYAVYILVPEGNTCRALLLKVPEGQYMVEFVDVCSGDLGKTETAVSTNGVLRLELPRFERDLAIRMLRLIHSVG